jgi:hypothetical protein
VLLVQLGLIAKKAWNIGFDSTLFSRKLTVLLRSKVREYASIPQPKSGKFQERFLPDYTGGLGSGEQVFSGCCIAARLGVNES